MKCLSILLLFIVRASTFPTPDGPVSRSFRKGPAGEYSDTVDDIILPVKANNIRRGAPWTDSPGRKWPTNQVVSYKFMEYYDDEYAQYIRDTFKFYSDNTCLTFQENGPTTPLIAINKKGGCSSLVGRNEGVATQSLSLGDSCARSSIKHEIAHSIGLKHTHVRFDRDSYVTVNITNVQPGYEHNFDKLKVAENNNFGVEYDYSSMMHYGDLVFAVDTNVNVLTAKDPYEQVSMGQTTRVSFSDLKLMNSLYECAKKCPSPSVKCQNSGIINSNTCNTCICPPMFTGADCSKRHPGKGVNASSPACGADLTATASWSNAVGSFGVYNQEIPLSECFWIIKAPEGRKVEIRMNRGGLYCNNLCSWNAIEVFTKGFVNGGYRFCCDSRYPDYLQYEGKVFQSKDNIMAISVMTWWSTPKLDFDYRLV